MKIFRLFIDENIKTWKKFSTKLAMILIILALVAALGFAKVLQYFEEKNPVQVAYDSSYWEEDVNEDIKACKEQLEDEYITKSEKEMLQNRIRIGEIRLQYNLTTHSSNWKNKELSLMETGIDEKLLDIIIKNDFSSYIGYEKELIKQKLENKQITKEEYEDETLLLELQGKYEIGAAEQYETDWRQNVLMRIASAQESVRTGIDKSTNKVLTVEQKQEYEDEIKIDIYKIENNILEDRYSSKTNFRTLFESLAPSFVIAVIAIFAMIVAGGAISSEVSTGTIKFWALTPNKRWKILTAKILSLLFYIIVITLIMSILSVLCANIFFDTPGSEYLYVKNGNVAKIGNIIFTLEYYFAKIIPVILFALFAFMLSVITRNTSVALSLSLAIYMGNSVVMMIINSYVKKDWVKFIPFNNLNIADKIFPNFDSLINIGASGATSTSFGFSLGVLAVCTILMLVTMYDSFNKRDII